MMRASVTNCAVIAALIDQPTTRRENRSMTAATYSQPSAVQTYVKSAIHLRLGADASKVRSSTFGATAPGLPLTQIRRQAAPARTCFEGLYRHQSLDPVQTTRQSLRQQVSPHAPGAVGPITCRKACAHLRTELFIASAALTARSG